MGLSLPEHWLWPSVLMKNAVAITCVLHYNVNSSDKKTIKGAAAIGAYLLETYGEDSISMIVDEGGERYPDQKPI